MSTRLVRSWIKTEIQEKGSLILRSVKIGSAERVGQVVAVESAASGGKDLDTVSLELQGVDGLSGIGEHHRARVNHRANVLVLDRHSVKGNGIISHNFTLRLRGAVKLLVSQEGHSVPVAVLVRVGSSDVLGRAQTDIHRLNGPLKLRQQDVVGGLEHAAALEAVNADQAETTIIPISLGYLFPRS